MNRLEHLYYNAFNAPFSAMQLAKQVLNGPFQQILTYTWLFEGSRIRQFFIIDLFCHFLLVSLLQAKSKSVCNTILGQLNKLRFDYKNQSLTTSFHPSIQIFWFLIGYFKDYVNPKCCYPTTTPQNGWKIIKVVGPQPVVHSNTHFPIILVTFNK